MSLPCLPEIFKVVQGLEPQAGAALTGDYVSLKNVHVAFVIVHVTQAHAAQMVIGINQATAVAPTGAGALAAVFPIWANLDCAASDTLVRATDAATYTLDVGIKHKIVVFQIDPRILTAGYDCIAVTTGASNALNITEVMYLLYERYQQATPPAAITD